eukprot:SAG22_NODE_2954_length_2078_cov_2.190500_2_plen_60_part_00
MGGEGGYGCMQYSPPPVPVPRAIVAGLLPTAAWPGLWAVAAADRSPAGRSHDDSLVSGL